MTEDVDNTQDLAIGDYFPRLRREVSRLGGSLDACPFSTSTYQYTGPVIRWTDGYPWMQSSKSQGELFHEGSLRSRERAD